MIKENRARRFRYRAVLLSVLLLTVLLWSGCAPSAGETPPPEEPAALPLPLPAEEGRPTETPSAEPAEESPGEAAPSEPSPEPAPDPVPEAAPAPEASLPTDPTPEPPPPEADPTCTLTVLYEPGLDWQDPDILSLLPPDGVIFPETTLSFREGESVFDLLHREMAAAGIPLEFVHTPAYHTVYIEGIAGLYEKYGGPLSGWTYTVNGVSPNFGCSQYLLQTGDAVVWLYTSLA